MTRLCSTAWGGSRWIAVFAFASGAALAQDWPTKPIRMIVPYPPAGGTDIGGEQLAEGNRQDGRGARLAWRQDRPDAGGPEAATRRLRGSRRGPGVVMRTRQKVRLT